MAFGKRDKLTGQRLPYLLNTRTFMNHTLYAPYVYLPIACAFCWLAALLAMMGLWVKSGKPRYTVDEPSTVFISNVAGMHKWVFVPLCACTVGFYVASLLAERALRSADHLPRDVRRRTKWFGWLAIIFSACGGAALILLGVFDCFAHSTVHWSMACVFIVCVAISAILQTGQIWSLHKDHPHRKSLFRNSIWKLIIVAVAVLGAIGFGSCYAVCKGNNEARGSRTAHQCDLVSSAAAALEWTIAFILFFYFLTLAGDMWPASKYSRRYQRKLTVWREKNGFVTPPAAVATHDQVTGLNGYSNTEPIDQWETVQPIDADLHHPYHTQTTTTAYGKPVQDFYDEDPERQYVAQPHDWEFVQPHPQQYDRQGMAYPPVQQQDGYVEQPQYPQAEYAEQPNYSPQQQQGYAEQLNYPPTGTPSRFAVGSYTGQPVPPPSHAEHAPRQPPVSYQPAGERIDPQVGWQQHASWRGTCTPQDVAGFRAPESPVGAGVERRNVRQTETVLPSNAY